VSRGGRLLALLVGLNLVNYLDRYVPAAVLPLIEKELGLSHARAGLLGTAFVLVYALASPLAGWLGDRGSRTRLAAASALGFGLACLGSGLAPGFALLLLTRALTGIGEAGFVTVTPSLVSDLYPRERRGWALSLFYTAMPVGSALGYLVGGWVGARVGWRTAFFVAAAPALLLGVVMLFAREPRRGAQDAPAEAAAPARFGDLLRKRSFLANNVGQILLTFGLGGIAFWMPSYLHEVRGLPLDRAGAFFGGVLAAGGFAGTLAGGAASAWLARRHRGSDFLVAGAGMSLATPFAAVAVLAPWPWVYWSALFAAVACTFANTGPLNAAIVNVVPAGLRATAIAWNVLLIHLFGDALSPYLLGLIGDRAGLRAAVLAASVALLAGGLWLLATAGLLARDLGPGGAGPGDA
jgi:predicted MFS family arabinose efflux permease